MAIYHTRLFTRSIWSLLMILVIALTASPVFATADQITEYTLPTAGSVPVVTTLGPDGNMWITENNANQIAKMTPTGQFTEYPLGGGTAPTGIATGPDNNLWIAESSSTANAIVVMNTSGQVIATYPIPTANSSPASLKAGDGGLWFLEFNPNKIARITVTGQITEFSVPEANPSLAALAVGTQNRIWFTDTNANIVGRLNATNGRVTQFPIPTASSDPERLVVGPSGDLFVSEFNASKIAKMTPTGTFTEYSTPTASSEPNGIALGPDGNLWICEWAANQIARMTPTGTFLSETPVPTASAEVNNIQVGPGGRRASMYFTEYAASKIGVITTR